MSKLMNLLRRNPRMTFASIVLVIALIAVIVWLVTRGEKKSTDTGPELEVTGEKIVKSVNTSEYAFRKMEYAGEDSEHRGWNIDFTITIDTKGGFEEAGINYIRIDRYDDSSPTKVLLDTQYTDQISNYGSFEVDFLGGDLKEDAVGTSGGNNTFDLYGVKTKGPDSTQDVLYNGTETGTGTPPVKLATTTEPIDETDLNYTLDNASKVAFMFDLGSDSGSSLPFIDTTVTRTKYSISIDPTNIYSLVPATDSSGVIANKYKFKGNDGNFLTANGVNVFKIDASYGGNRYRAYTDDNKILTREGGTGNLVLKIPTDMDLTEAETSLMTFTVVQTTPACKNIDVSCTRDAECCDNYCHPRLNLCRPNCKGLGASCSRDADCCDNNCEPDGTCGYVLDQ